MNIVLHINLPAYCFLSLHQSAHFEKDNLWCAQISRRYGAGMENSKTCFDVDPEAAIAKALAALSPDDSPYWQEHGLPKSEN